MRQQRIFALIGGFIGAAVDLVINLVAAAIQQKTFSDQFSNQAIWGLIIYSYPQCQDHKETKISDINTG